MPGLVPGIHVLGLSKHKDVDGRDKPGHDEWRRGETTLHTVAGAMPVRTRKASLAASLNG